MSPTTSPCPSWPPTMASLPARRSNASTQSALEIAQKYGIGDSASFPEPREIETRYEFVDKWRAAVVKQLLTPAPDGAAVTWKRAQLAGRGFSHLPTKAERIERVIADDVAFLAAHPTRTKKGGSSSSAGADRSESATASALPLTQDG
jgi:hypothetical protein